MTGARYWRFCRTPNSCFRRIGTPHRNSVGSSPFDLPTCGKVISMDDRRSYIRLWVAFALVMVLSFAVLGGYGFRIAAMAPPIPESVRTPDGKVVVTGDLSREGQNGWQSLGGQEIGSVWGHGAYVAPDWSADWLHRELVAVLDTWAVERGSATYSALVPADQAVLRERLRSVFRTNAYEASI